MLLMIVLITGYILCKIQNKAALLKVHLSKFQNYTPFYTQELKKPPPTPERKGEGGGNFYPIRY